MADDPKPTPLPYIDAENQALLEQAAKLAGNKPINSLSLQDLRQLFHELALPAPTNPGIDITHFLVPTSQGEVKVFLYKPRTRASEQLPFVYHLHGGGWFTLEAFFYERFVFDLIIRTGYAVALTEYTLAPESKFPVQQEQCLDVLKYLVQHGHTMGLSTKKVVLTGDSAGGQLAPALSILNSQRSLKLPIAHQILLHPIVNSHSLISTFSQWLFQNGPFITTDFAREVQTDYFSDLNDSTELTASPILMTKEQAKRYMPPTTIVTSQSDWLRDQGQNFGKLLQQAGVSCGIVQAVASVHDTEVFPISRTSPTAELIMIMISGKIREVIEQGDGAGTNGHYKEEEKPSKKRRRG